MMSADPHDEQVLTARWVFPVAGPPLEGGTVTVRGERIAAVSPRGARTADVDFGNAAFIPGLVNAHTHLDLSRARGLIPPPHYGQVDRGTKVLIPESGEMDWLRGVISFRRSQTAEQTLLAVRVGLDEALRFGTTLVGDIAAGGVSWSTVSASLVYGVVFHEMIGLSKARSREVVPEALKWTTKTHDTCRPGLSPHAAYSFRYQTLEKVCRLTWLPVTIHLAEFQAEMELLERHSGPFVPFLAERGAWDPSGLAWSTAHVVKLCSGGAKMVFAHCNYLSPEASIPANASIVYCPRTHAAFGHPPHPFRAFLARGVRVALGTDSLASNPDLDLLAEARFIHERYPDFPGDQLLRMATLSGAEALGWADETGSLEPGKSADLVVLPLPDVEGPDPHRLIFGCTDPPGAVRRSMWRGRWRNY